jgi:hypothetical protein
MHFNRLTLTIPPNQTTAISTTCTIPANFGTIGLVTGVSHMHRHGVHFNAQTTTGIELVDTDQWDEAPPVDYPEPIMLNPGDGIKWTCTFNNTTAQTITYGDSAIKNEMCIYIARFVSSPSGDDLECETIFPSFAAQATKNVAGM